MSSEEMFKFIATLVSDEMMVQTTLCTEQNEKLHSPTQFVFKTVRTPDFPSGEHDLNRCPLSVCQSLYVALSVCLSVRPFQSLAVYFLS